MRSGFPNAFDHFAAERHTFLLPNGTKNAKRSAQLPNSNFS